GGVYRIGSGRVRDRRLSYRRRRADARLLMKNLFDLSGRVAVITGGAGLLGGKHAEAIASAGGVPVLVDISSAAAQERAAALRKKLGIDAVGIGADITDPEQVETALARVIAKYSRVDILSNNGANNPKMGRTS